MKKLFVIGALVLATTPSFAKIGSTLTVTNDYIWRGLTQGAGPGPNPAVMGSLDYSDESGLGAGLFATNAGSGAAAASEFDAYVNYSFDAGGVVVTPMIYSYGYAAQYPQNNSIEVGVTASTMGFKFYVGQIGKAFGVESSWTYVNLGYAYEIQKGLNAVASVGMNTLGDEKKFAAGGSYVKSGWMDYKLALQYSNEGWTTEMGMTKTNRQTTDGTTTTNLDKEERPYVNISHSF